MKPSFAIRFYAMVFLSHSLTGCRTLKESDSAIKIYGGDTLQEGDPVGESFVELARISNGLGSSCSGTLIDAQVVLTAAHCVTSRIASLTAIFGIEKYLDNGNVIERLDVDIVPFPGKFVVSHYGYKDEPKYDPAMPDLALIFLPESVPDLQGKKKLKQVLKPASIGATDPNAGDMITLVGQGWTENGDPMTARRLELPAMTDARYPGIRKTIGFEKGACGGDSGGGVFLNDKLVGVIAASDCKARFDYTGKDISTSILLLKPYQNWIAKQIADWKSGQSPSPGKLGPKIDVAKVNPVKIKSVLGYIKKTADNEASFIGVDRDIQKVGLIRSLNFFTLADQDIFRKCRKEKKAILIEMPGVEVKGCELPPGFFKEWYRIVVIAEKIDYWEI